MKDLDCRTSGARIAGRVAAIGWPFLLALIILGSFAFGVVREAMIWGVW